ncbi:hypothetical protein RI367_007400 [Sorochytrium milnesiophthora]
MSPPSHMHTATVSPAVQTPRRSVPTEHIEPIGAPVPASYNVRHSMQQSDFGTLTRHLRQQSNATTSSTPQEEVQLQRAIALHEEMRLEESTKLFKLVADTMNSPTGMFMYGMALRSGWGCKPDEKLSFEYLSRAAEIALRRADRATQKAATRELTLAIYELGQSFAHGWGVKKCRRTGAFYLQIAANLGDADAQVDVALSFLNGDGVKRDKQMAAKYFRMASNSGIELPNNTWIWKEKYDSCGVTKVVKAP